MQQLHQNIRPSEQRTQALPGESYGLENCINLLVGRTEMALGGYHSNGAPANLHSNDVPYPNAGSKYFYLFQYMGGKTGLGQPASDDGSGWSNYGGCSEGALLGLRNRY